jgi:uncharacterized protein
MTNDVLGRPARGVFLSAEWRDLVMLNYEVDPMLLKEYVPRGTELDSFQGKTYVSLVGFRFLRTKLFGFVPIPFHANFDEVNLLFYVRRRDGETVRRGVVFIREIVPKRAIALVARTVYGENYTRHPMRHSIHTDEMGAVTADYSWKLSCMWCQIRCSAAGTPFLPAEGSLEQFITEHYWGYAAQRRGGTIEYQVTHVPWLVWKCTGAGFEGDGAALYGHGFGMRLRGPPDCAFIADGSSVQVLMGRRIS